MIKKTLSKIFLFLLSSVVCSCSKEEIIPEDPGPMTPYDKSSAEDIKANPLKIKMPLQSRKKWKVLYVNSHMSSAKCGPEKAFDDNPKTHWHTEWKPKKPKPPHELHIDMGEELTICGFTQLPRQDKLPNGITIDYQFFVSNDAKAWGQPISQGAFKNNKKNRTEQLVYFKNKDGKTQTRKGRYIRFVAQKGYKKMPFTSLAELNVIIEE